MIKRIKCSDLEDKKMKKLKLLLIILSMLTVVGLTACAGGEFAQAQKPP